MTVLLNMRRQIATSRAAAAIRCGSIELMGHSGSRGPARGQVPSAASHALEKDRSRIIRCLIESGSQRLHLRPIRTCRHNVRGFAGSSNGIVDVDLAAGDRQSPDLDHVESIGSHAYHQAAGIRLLIEDGCEAARDGDDDFAFDWAWPVRQEAPYGRWKPPAEGLFVEVDWPRTWMIASGYRSSSAAT